MTGIQNIFLDESEADLLRAIDQAKLRSASGKRFLLRMEDRYNLAHIGEIGYTVEENTPLGKICGHRVFYFERALGPRAIQQRPRRLL